MFEGNRPLEVVIKRETEQVYLIKLKGRIDSDTYKQLDEKVSLALVPSTNTIILDMEEVNYVSSAGLGVIFNLKKTLEENKGSLIISGLKPQVKKVFEVVKALPEENIFTSRKELDKYLDVIQKREIEKGEKPL